MWFPDRSEAVNGYAPPDLPTVEKRLFECDAEGSAGAVLFFDFDYDARQLLVGKANGFQIWDLEAPYLLHEEGKERNNPFTSYHHQFPPS